MRKRRAKIIGFGVGFAAILLVILIGSMVVAFGKQYSGTMGYRLALVGAFATFAGVAFAPGLGILVTKRLASTD